MASARYRDRHGTSGAKSDPGDAKVLADLVRTDRHNHRPVAGDSDLAEGVKLLARAHQNAIWARQRQLNALRSALREYYPAALAAFGTDLASSDALAVLARRPHARARPGPVAQRRSRRRFAEAAVSATSSGGPRRSKRAARRPAAGPARSSPAPTGSSPARPSA